MRLITNSHIRKHVTTTILQLLLLGLTFGLQQSPTFSSSAIRQISFQKHSKWSLLSHVSAGVEDTEESAYDWDEQFEELKLFMAQYGHCNFPPNPPEYLVQTYPVLKRFCQDQREEYRKLQEQNRRNKGNKMTLQHFDRYVRCHQLEELGFEFISQPEAAWYDYYHDLIKFKNENGHVRVTEKADWQLRAWVNVQRCRRKGTMKGRTRLPNKQIKLLDDIGFEWTSTRLEKWHAMYQELVAFREQHGNFLVPTRTSLFNWMDTQRRAGKKGKGSLTDDQMRLLDEIDFPWEPERRDGRWNAMYDELQKFQKKYGHAQPTRGVNDKLYLWSSRQQQKRRKGRLSAEQIELLNKLDFNWERKSLEWPRMLRELTEYYKTHGHLRVNQEDDPELFNWIDAQRKRYHSPSGLREMLSDEQINKLEDLHFCWSLDWRDRSWHEIYTEAVEFFKDNGHICVAKNDHPSLYNWIQMQEKRYKEMEGQKPLSEEQLEMLEQIDFPFLEGQPRMAWKAKYAELERYSEEHAGRLPTSHKDDPDLNRWVRQQRYRYRCAYGYAPLLDDQKSLLDSTEFPIYPNGKQQRSWYEKYDELSEFWKQHGHFAVDREENRDLYRWLRVQRGLLNGNAIDAEPLSKLKVYLLERIEFPLTSDRYAVVWQMMYDEVVQFLDAKGRFPSKLENKKLYNWISAQQKRYKGQGSSRQLSNYQIQQLEKIGLSWWR